MKPIITLLIAICFLAASSFPLAQSHAMPHLPLHLTGAVISAGGVGNPTGTARVEITVDRWSSMAEREKLINALNEKGQDALLDELRRAPSVGSIRFNTQLAWDLRYARQLPRDDGGMRVFLATDRPMGVREIWNDPRYSDYPFTLIELQFDPDGGRKGSLMLAARVTADKDERLVEVENYASQSIPITQIESR